jgi:hypothetical protein
MRIIPTLFGLATLCIYLVAMPVALAEQDSVVVDSHGDYVITYHDRFGNWITVKWIPATKINPLIRGFTRPAEKNHNHLLYRYTIQNHKDSAQFFSGFRLHASNVTSADSVGPNGWTGDIVLDRAAGSGFLVAWSYWKGDGTWEAGLKPGDTTTGFGFESTDLPGVGAIAAWGAAPPTNGFPDEGPNDEQNPTIIARVDEITSHDEVTLLAAAPRIKIPDPFDAAVVLTGIKAHLDGDLVSMKLVDATLVADLDHWLAAAIAAAQTGNNKAEMNGVQQAQLLLKREYPDVDRDDGDGGDQSDKRSSHIDQLAARVLDFDLRYVVERIDAGDSH